MFRKAFTLVLLGVLVMGTVTVAYGTYTGGGFLASTAALLGAEGGHHDKHGGEHDHDDD